MNQEQAVSALRMLLQWLGVYVVSKGWTDESTATAVGGAILTLVVAGWGIYARRNAGLVASAATVPSVQAIVDPKLAERVPSPKVVAR